MTKNDTTTRKYNDLCESCKNLSTCVYIQNGKRPVLYCEEFELYEVIEVQEKPPATEQKTEEEQNVFTGLCKNCDNRHTCMNARPDRIIWHCEEYV
jgi:hypothetical protein